MNRSKKCALIIIIFGLVGITLLPLISKETYRRQISICEGNELPDWNYITTSIYWDIKLDEQINEYNQLINSIKDKNIPYKLMGYDNGLTVYHANIPYDQRYLAGCNTSIAIYKAGENIRKVIIPIVRKGKINAFEYYGNGAIIDKDCEISKWNNWYYCTYFVES